MNDKANREVANVFREAALKTSRAKSVTELVELVQIAYRTAKKKAYMYGEQNCLSCSHFERDGELMSGNCLVKFTQSRWAGDKPVPRYVSKSAGQKCRQYDPRQEKDDG